MSFFTFPSSAIQKPTDLINKLSADKSPFGLSVQESVSPYIHLDAHFESLLIAAPILTISELGGVEEKPGVYIVYYEGRLVYIGTSENLYYRIMKNHVISVISATGLDETKIWFRFHVCEDNSARWCIEHRLIAHYSPEWNSMGFGRRIGASADRQQPSKWDKLYGRILPVGGQRDMKKG